MALKCALRRCSCWSRHVRVSCRVFPHHLHTLFGHVTVLWPITSALSWQMRQSVYFVFVMGFCTFGCLPVGDVLTPAVSVVVLASFVGNRGGMNDRFDQGRSVCLMFFRNFLYRFSHACAALLETWMVSVSIGCVWVEAVAIWHAATFVVAIFEGLSS